MLSAIDILSVDDLAREEMDVPEWGGKICVREMTGTELAEWQRIAQDPEREDVDAVVALAMFTVCDSEGNRLFDMNTFDALKQKSIQVILQIQEVALRVNRLTEQDQAELKGNL
jgi:hypothetical protein